MANQMPERVINYRAYGDGGKLVGTVDVTMPEITFKTDTVEGAGIAGSFSSPVPGMLEDMTCSINWRTVEKSAIELLTPNLHTLELRASQQSTEVSSGTISTVPVKISMKVVPTGFSTGTLAMGATTGSSSNFSVYQIKMWRNGEELLEIDKPNFICRINGVDYLANVREDLGE